jgi:hypothetical protein
LFAGGAANKSTDSISLVKKVQKVHSVHCPRTHVPRTASCSSAGQEQRRDHVPSPGLRGKDYFIKLKPGKVVLTLHPPLRPFSHDVDPRDGAQDIKNRCKETGPEGLNPKLGGLQSYNTIMYNGISNGRFMIHLHLHPSSPSDIRRRSLVGCYAGRNLLRRCWP